MPLLAFGGMSVRLYISGYWNCCLPPVMRTIVLSVDIVAVMLAEMFGKMDGINGDPQRLVQVQYVAVNKREMAQLLYTHSSCITPG